MKIEAFMPLADFVARMEDFIDRLKALKPAHGFDEVLYPGEPEARTHAARLRSGVPLTPEVMAPLEALAAATGIAFPHASLAPLDSESDGTAPG